MSWDDWDDEFIGSYLGLRHSREEREQEEPQRYEPTPRKPITRDDVKQILITIGAIGMLVFLSWMLAVCGVI